MSATGIRLTQERMQFVPPTLDGITRKRPCIDTPMMPSLSSATTLEAQACAQASSPGSLPTKLSPAGRFEPYFPDEFEEIGRLMSMARGRYIDLANRYAALRQDATSLQSKLGETQIALESEKASTARAYTSITELQSLGGHLMERIRLLGTLKGTIGQKRDSIDELINSMRELKKKFTDDYQKLVTESARLTFELSSERKESGELVERLRGTMIELEKTKGTLEKEFQTVDSERKKVQEELDTLSEVYRREKKDLECSVVQSREELRKQDLLLQEYKKEMCENVLMMSKQLGCRAPASFGDRGGKALSVIIDECIAEHKAFINLKEQEQLVLIEALRLELTQAKTKVAKLEEGLLSRQSAEEAKSQDIAADLTRREQYIQKLENRITDMQLEASGNASKLAELQKLRVVYQVVQELIFQGQDINGVEYADLRCLVSEEVSHNSCNSQIQEAEARAARHGTECEHLCTQLQNFKKEAQAREKALQDKITALVSQLDTPGSSVPRSAAPTGPKDKTVVEGLIQLIEQDTQELKAISVGKATSSSALTPSQPTRRGRSASRTSSSVNKFNKRSPLPSNQSEIDLWSIFASKKSK